MELGSISRGQSSVGRRMQVIPSLQRLACVPMDFGKAKEELSARRLSHPMLTLSNPMFLVSTWIARFMTSTRMGDLSSVGAF